jgi:hypothetical protein
VFSCWGKFRRSSFSKEVVAACFQSSGKFRKSCGPDENGEKGENQRSISTVILIQTLELAGRVRLLVPQVVDKGDKEGDRECE